MNGFITKRLFQLFAAAVWLIAPPAMPPTQAAEPTQLFLEQLRLQGYQDMALEYLERMSSSPLASDEFKQTISLERGATFIEQSGSAHDPAVKQQLLADAKLSLDAFVEQQADHPRIGEAHEQLRKILFERAKIIVGQAKQEDDAEKRAQLMEQARESFGAAREAYYKRRDAIKDELEHLKSVPAAERDPTRVSQLRGEFVETKLVAATISYELAKTMKDNPEEYKKLLEEAAANYADIAKKYRRLLGGMFAVFYEGRCHQDLGQLKDALARYEKILEEPNLPGTFQSLKTMTIKHAVECWVSEEINQLDLAIETGQEWDKSVRPGVRNSVDGLGLQLALARANLTRAEGASRDERVRFIGAARKFATAVSKAPGPLQADARELLSQLRGEGEVQIDLSGVKTFSEAQAAAQQALEQMQATENGAHDAAGGT